MVVIACLSLCLRVSLLFAFGQVAHAVRDGELQGFGQRTCVVQPAVAGRNIDAQGTVAWNKA